MKLSGMIPLVIVSHFELSESRSCDWRPSWIFSKNAISGHFEGLQLVAAAFLTIVCALGTLYAFSTLILALGTLHRPIFGCPQHLVCFIFNEKIKVCVAIAHNYLQTNLRRIGHFPAPRNVQLTSGARLACPVTAGPAAGSSDAWTRLASRVSGSLVARRGLFIGPGVPD